MEFTYMLAGHLGKTVGELDDMPALEFMCWKEFWRRHPFGDTRYLLSVIAAIIANALRGENSKAIEIDTIMRSMPDPPKAQEISDKPQPAEQARIMAEAVVAALNGDKNRG
jgi:hypothetical protein